MAAAASSSSSAAAAGLLVPGVDHADFRPGSIKKLELTNFMTHAYVELRPSSAVNFVLGANGSGKSSLVCALCLGLGGDVRDMERGKELKAYVMTGKTEATIKVRWRAAPRPPTRARARRGRCAPSCAGAPPRRPARLRVPLFPVFARSPRASQTLLTGRPSDAGDWEVVRTLKTTGGNSWRINNTDVAHDGAAARCCALPPLFLCTRARASRPLPPVLACALAHPLRAQTRCAFCARKCPSRWTTSACSCRRSA
jgi:hypothetical protein